MNFDFQPTELSEETLTFLLTYEQDMQKRCHDNAAYARARAGTCQLHATRDYYAEVAVTYQQQGAAAYRRMAELRGF
jgi:hypothetical protein